MSHGRGFESQQRRCVVFLSQARHLHDLVLVQPRKQSRQIVDWDVKPQPKQTKDGQRLEISDSERRGIVRFYNQGKSQQV